MSSVRESEFEARGDMNSSQTYPSIGCYVNDVAAKKHKILTTPPIEYERKRREKKLFLSLIAGVLIIGSGLLFGLQRHIGENESVWQVIAEKSGQLFWFAKFPVEQVHIVGHRQTSEREVITSLGDIWQASLLSVDTETAQSRIERLPWVKEAIVERVFPHGLNIYIRERVAIGRWVTPTGSYIFDQTGYVIGPARVGRFMDLEIFAGRGAPDAANRLITVLKKFSQLRPNILQYSRVGERRWTLNFRNGIAVMLPETQLEGALARLEELHTTHNILNRALTAIDLRLADRVTLQPKSSAKSKTIGAEDTDSLDVLAENQINRIERAQRGGEARKKQGI